jgi:hypothetical protein
MLDVEIQDAGITMSGEWRDSVGSESESTIIDKGFNKLHHDHLFCA